MQLDHIDHMNIRCGQEDLPAMRRFYGDVLGLRAGPRPDFPTPGIWFYLGDNPVVHVSTRPGGRPVGAGAYDHVSFRARDVEATRLRLRAHGVMFEEAPVPGFPLHQIFMNDPAGAKVELTFELPEKAQIHG